MNLFKYTNNMRLYSHISTSCTKTMLKKDVPIKTSVDIVKEAMNEH